MHLGLPGILWKLRPKENRPRWRDRMRQDRNMEGEYRLSRGIAGDRRDMVAGMDTIPGGQRVLELGWMRSG